MPKIYARNIFLSTDADHVPPPTKGNNREAEMDLVRHKNALVDVVRCFWNNDSLNMSEDKMAKLFRGADGKPLEPVSMGGKKLTGMEAVAAHLNDPRSGGLQILSPEDGKPHMIRTELFQLSISDEPVREPELPRKPEPPKKPGLWVRFLHAIFHNQKKMDDYNDAKRTYETESMPRYEQRMQEYESKTAQRNAYIEENKAVLDTHAARKDKLHEVEQVPQANEVVNNNRAMADLVLSTPEEQRKTLFAQRDEIQANIKNPDRQKLNNQDKSFGQMRDEIGAPKESNLQKLDKLAQKAMTNLQKAVNGDRMVDVTKNMQRVTALRSVYASPEIAKNLETFNGRIDDWVEKQIPAAKMDQVQTLSGGRKTAAKLCLDTEGTATVKALCSIGTKKEPAKPLFNSEKTVQKEVSRSAPAREEPSLGMK